MIINKMKFDDMRPLYDDVTLEVGLINGRHENPVDLYIFNGKDNPKEDAISDELMFDYAEQYDIISDFIDEHAEVKVDGKYRYKDIVAYVSGLVCVSASLIDVCYDNEINLTLKHYNKSLTEKLGKDTYSDQVLIEDSDNSVYGCLSELYPTASTKNIFLDKGVDIFKFNRKSKLFYVNIYEYIEGNDERFSGTTKVYLFNKKTRAKAFYKNIASSMTAKSPKKSESPVKYNIKLGRAKMDDGVFDFEFFTNIMREIDITYCE